MARPSLAVVSAGYKPHVAGELLGVGRETLRYWRTHLDPHPERHHFSGGTLLAYRILKTLIRRRYLPAALLMRCSRDALFLACEREPLRFWRDQVVLVHECRGTLTWQRLDHALDVDDLFLHTLILRPVIAEHLAAFSELGATQAGVAPVERVESL